MTYAWISGATPSSAVKLKDGLAVAYPDIRTSKARTVKLHGDESTLQAGMKAGRALSLDRPLSEDMPKRIAQ